MTTPGLAGCGFVGIAIEKLAAPVQDALATAGTGGTIAAGTYIYAVTATNANGESLRSNEQTITTSGTTSTVTVSWQAVPGATGYKLYKTAAGGASGTELHFATVGEVTTYTDTAPGSPSGALPTTNTALAPGVYTAPTKYVPIRSESLQYRQATTWRRPIRGTVDVVGAVAGNVHIEGDIVIEAQPDTCIYFHEVTRATRTKTGAGPYTYGYTNNCGALAARTASVTVVRNGVVFGYVGCVVGQFKYNMDAGMVIGTYSIVGSDEAVQASPTPTWPTTVPFGTGMTAIQIPTATAVFDCDGFDFTVNDNAEPQNRTKNTGRGAQFMKFGERAVSMTTTRDFLNRTEYDAYKALTAQSISIVSEVVSSGEKMTIVMPATIKDSHEVALGGQGDLVVASITYNAVIDSTGKSYSVEFVTAENLT